MTGYPRSVPRRPLDASLSFWPLCLVFLQKNLKQFKCYRSHMIYEVNGPSLRALMKTRDPRARQAGRPWDTLLLLSSQPEGSPPGRPQCPAIPSPMSPRRGRPQRDSAVSQPSVNTRTCFPGGVGCAGGSRRTTFGDRMSGRVEGLLQLEHPPRIPVSAAPTVRGAGAAVGGPQHR